MSTPQAEFPSLEEVIRVNQKAAIAANIEQHGNWYAWTRQALDIGLQGLVALNHPPLGLEARRDFAGKHRVDPEHFNVIVNLCYDAIGTLFSALQLAMLGNIGDAWSLVREALEATCYSEYLALRPDLVEAYLEVGELIKRDVLTDQKGVNVGKEFRKRGLGPSQIMGELRRWDCEDRRAAYAKACTWGAHASPVRISLRLQGPNTKAKILPYASTDHTWAPALLANLAAVSKYASGIPFDERLDLARLPRELDKRYIEYEARYDDLFRQAEAQSS